MRFRKISDAVIRRLPLYLRVLDSLANDPSTKSISSQELGVRSGIGPALVRKDLAWFGEFGKQGVGYEVEFLQAELRRILNLDKRINAGLVGAGSLGMALTRYIGKRSQEDDSFNINLVALFESESAKVGNTVNDVPVFSVKDMIEKIPEMEIQMGIIAVPAENGQTVANLLVKSDIKAILNFAPVKLDVPQDVHVANADVSLELQRLAYYLQTDDT